VNSKGVACGWGQVLAVKDTVQAVLDAGLLLDHLSAMRDQRAQVTHVLRRHPDFRDQVSCQELRQAHGILRIGLNSSRGDPLDLERVGHHAASDQRNEQIVQVPSVAGGFQDNGILRSEMGLSPGGEVVQVDAPWFEEHLLSRIYSGNDHEVLVQVNADTAAWGKVGFTIHRFHLLGG
jgi:hypothetical protein